MVDIILMNVYMVDLFSYMCIRDLILMYVYMVDLFSYMCILYLVLMYVYMVDLHPRMNHTDSKSDAIHHTYSHIRVHGESILINV